MRKKLFTIATLLAFLFTSFITPGYAYGNPYPGGWDNCTWSAWTLVYNSTGIALPSWGNAGSWLYNAAAQGWATGSTPASNSIAVYSHHVVYVTSYDGGDQMYVQEGGYLGGYHEGYAYAYGGRGSQALLGFIYLGGGGGYSAPAQTYNQASSSGTAQTVTQVRPRKEEIVIEVDPEAAMSEDVFLSSLKYEEIELEENPEVTISYRKHRIITLPKRESAE